ncbi:probable inactive receptor kinase At5g67200 [Juglans microcarpa x Juglans regia]|uniref:probable inactive receptor kinase At5g67200 n=1 Tax=Juglans microcarpa x Juglans regia TaxID=2249226 RepID=UPI001B7EA329|nr:probable inactive receptor kinase At5g67200 [Juglans microcarpa x Juglans regia]
MLRKKRQPRPLIFLLFVLNGTSFWLSLCSFVNGSSSSRPFQLTHPWSPSSLNLEGPPRDDALNLLAFKSNADSKNKLLFSSNATSHFCQWQGVKCAKHKVVRLVLEGLDLCGVLAPDTLSRLDRLRVLSLQNNSLTGTIPDLSELFNLKTLFLDHNLFTGSFPTSILSLPRLRTIDISYNNLTGMLPSRLAALDRLYYLRLDWNRLNGTVPALRQSSLQIFNVSGNNLSGPIPVTPTLIRFSPSSFSWNPNLCGEIIKKVCHPGPPFFGLSAPFAAPPPSSVLGQSAQVHGLELTADHEAFQKKKHKRTAVIMGFSVGVLVLICSLICFATAVKKGGRNNKDSSSTPVMISSVDTAATAEAAAVMQTEQEKELEEKVKRVQGMQVAKSGSLVFCAGEAQLYTMEQLMRGSAELLGRGTIGTTYKAVLDNRMTVSVKRLDAGKLDQSTSKETFERHMESVGGLRHPNLVPMRAYFQNKEERLVVYDFQKNGSLFSLIHGSKSRRAKPLHWTSCLKIAEDVAQGLSYIHQAWRLVHGNLKSSNVLLGPDFEACVADYCLSVLANPSSDPNPDPDSTAVYKAPETRNSVRQATSKSDVYSYGILLLELLTGKAPSQLPYLMPNEMVNWVRSMREEDDGRVDNRMEMLLEVAISCTLSSPEQRPTMWQVLKMLQEIKETVLMEDNELDPH